MTQSPIPSPISEFKAASAPPAPSPLTADQLAAVKRAHERAAKIRRASAVAFADGSVMALFSVVCLMSAFPWGQLLPGGAPIGHWLWTIVTHIDLLALALGIGLAIVTFNSLRGAARLKRFDPAAPAYLAWNQFFLAAIVILYAAYSLYSVLNTSINSDPNVRQIAQMDPAIGQMIGETYQLIFKILYIGLIVGTIIAQGLAALYYYSRGRFLRAYLAETPTWILELQKQQVAR